MDYIPNTDADLQAMLKEIGVDSFERLIEAVPKGVRLKGASLPPPVTEMELVREMEALAAMNQPSGQVLSFLGAGAYEHFIPSAVDHLAGRGEFTTAYTPYQAEASQGTLQAIYEYQSFIASLTGLPVSNASLYDGSSAVAEAAWLAMSVNPGRLRVGIAASVHPDYRRNLATCLAGSNVEVVEFPCRGGVVDVGALASQVDESFCAVIVQTPNFFGCLEDMEAITVAVHGKGALMVAVVNPVSLGLLRPPGEYGADLAVGEGQPLGIPLSYGGPWLGFLATSKKLVHKISGRLVGLSEDEGGETAFCLTLQAREQHIRRERATSNICSNQSLMALRACIHMALLGRKGLVEVARLNRRQALRCAKALAALKGFSLAHRQPFFNEFVLCCPLDAALLVERCHKDGIVPGLPLAKSGMGASNELLVCVTEMRSDADIERLAHVLQRHSKS